MWFFACQMEPLKNINVVYFSFNYGLGENTDDPGCNEITNTNVEVGFMCIVSCIDAGFFRVPAAKDVSNGILLFMRMPVRAVNSYRDNCSLHKTFLNNVPESKVDICESNKTFPPYSMPLNAGKAHLRRHKRLTKKGSSPFFTLLCFVALLYVAKDSFVKRAVSYHQKPCLTLVPLISVHK